MASDYFSKPSTGARYFSGSELVKEFVDQIDERNAIRGKIFASWIDPNISQTSYCGNPSTIEIEEVFGIESHESIKLDHEIESGLGLPNLAEIRSRITKSSENTLSLSVSRSIKRTFDINSDKCGSSRLKIFQKVYTADLCFGKTSFFRGLKETHFQIVERTQNFEAIVTIEEYDPRCGCPTDRVKPNDGAIRISFGNLSLLTPFFITKRGFVTHVGSLEFGIDPRDLRGIAFAEINSDYIPEVFRYLAGISGEAVRFAFELWTISPYAYDAPRKHLQMKPAAFNNIGVQKLDFETVSELYDWGQ